MNELREEGGAWMEDGWMEPGWVDWSVDRLVHALGDGLLVGAMNGRQEIYCSYVEMHSPLLTRVESPCCCVCVCAYACVCV